jgi:uncharacterized protein YjbJ (UPF0337 family)
VQIGKVDLDELRGLGDKFVGLQKEFVGTLIGNERLQEEGEAQQVRATKALKGRRTAAKAPAPGPGKAVRRPVQHGSAAPPPPRPDSGAAVGPHLRLWRANRHIGAVCSPQTSRRADRVTPLCHDGRP